MTSEIHSVKMEASDSHPLLELSPQSIANTTHHLPQDHHVSPKAIPLAVQTSHQQYQGHVVSPITPGNLGANINTSSRKPSETSVVSGKAAQSTVNKNPVAKRRKRNLWTSVNRFICDTWLVEIASLVLSVGSLATITALLVVFNQRALPNWRYQINLNALVSIFATVLTSTLTQATGSATGE
jgi:hypothetical protein